MFDPHNLHNAKENKIIINIPFVYYRFKMRRAIIEPFFLFSQWLKKAFAWWDPKDNPLPLRQLVYKGSNQK